MLHARTVADEEVPADWPFMIFGNCLAMIAGGLLYTIGPDTSSAALTGFQILLGVGVGLTMQVRLAGPHRSTLC
jgi:hypothetical protein